MKAARLLKEVLKISTLDDSGAVEKLVGRVKNELKNLHKTDLIWKKFEDDDIEGEIDNLHR